MTAKTQREAVRSRLEGVSSVLLLAPSLSDHEDDVCADLLEPEADRATNALWVSYTKPPDAQLRRWRAAGGGTPAEVGIVSVDEASRSVSATTGTDSGPGFPSQPTETVTSPNDLTGLGITITEHLTEWNGNGNRTVMCFDSLTGMLQYVDLDTAYEFLHVILGRIQAVDAVAHFHMDPGAHDQQTVATITSLFDAAVEPTDDGHTIRRR